MRTQLFAVLIMLCVSLTCARHTSAAEGDPPTRAELAALSQKLHQQFEAKEYTNAEQTARKLAETLPKDPSAHYNLACALARQGKSSAALTELEQAITLGFLDTAHIASDEDLASLRTDKAFDALLKKAEASQPPPEKGINLPGVKTVEHQPAGGLAYRLRMSPAATKEKPNRLVIWFHPSGGSVNQGVEALAPQLIERGWALIVFTRKDWSGWSSVDLDKVTASIKHAAEQEPGLQTDKPILWGFSAGGQMILKLWQNTPAEYAGCIIGSAYPVETTERGNPVMKLPESPAIKDIPFFVTVGDADPGHTVWKKVEPDWTKAGIPVTVKYVPNFTHPMWPFKGELAKEMLEWVSKIKPAPKP